jgi:hypothetical protein
MNALHRDHRFEVDIKEWGRSREAEIGADWEMWFTDSRRSLWLGYRIQAKLFNRRTGLYEALDHRNTSGRQIELLIDGCASPGADERRPFPLYCFYNSIEDPAAYLPSFGPWYDPGRDHGTVMWGRGKWPLVFGCAFLDAYEVEECLDTSRSRLHRTKDVAKRSYPWAEILCPSVRQQRSFDPARTLGSAKIFLNQLVERQRRRGRDDAPEDYIHSEPPWYLREEPRRDLLPPVPRALVVRDLQ